jgi:hypothetical protein
MHPAWRPISRSEFDSLVAEQEAALDQGQKAMLDTCRVEPWQAIIRRSVETGDERVWVIGSGKEKSITLTTSNGVGTHPA